MIPYCFSGSLSVLKLLVQVPESEILGSRIENNLKGANENFINKGFITPGRGIVIHSCPVRKAEPPACLGNCAECWGGGGQSHCEHLSMRGARETRASLHVSGSVNTLTLDLPAFLSFLCRSV